MKYSYLSHLECPKCSETYASDSTQNLCQCGSPLLVQYDLDTLAKNWHPLDLKARRHDLWRYHELLPVRNKEHIVSLGEGMTDRKSVV